MLRDQPKQAFLVRLTGLEEVCNAMDKMHVLLLSKYDA